MSDSHLDRRSFVGGLAALAGVSPALAAIPDCALAADVATSACMPAGFVTFNQIPANLRIPLIYVEVDLGADTFGDER